MPQPTSATISIPASLATEISDVLTQIDTKQSIPQGKLGVSLLTRMRTAKKLLDAAIAVEERQGG